MFKIHPDTRSNLMLSPTRNSIAKQDPLLILRLVNLGWITRTFAMVSILLLVGTGCSGINTTQSISPLMFFLPGIGQTKPVQTEKLAQTPTSTVVETASLAPQIQK